MIARDDKELAAYLKAARTFDYDQRLAAERSKRFAWALAGAAGLLAIASVAALAALAPLKEVVPFVIRVDQATGVPEVMTALTDGRQSYDEAVARYFLARYARVRESYSFAERQNIFHEVTLMSAPEVTRQFSDFFNATNLKSPQYLYGRDTHVSIRIRSISFLGDQLAQVRFTRTERNEREKLKKETLWVSTIQFEFDPRAEISAEDRLVNPLGFIVRNYRVDPEVVQ